MTAFYREGEGEDQELGISFSLAHLPGRAWRAKNIRVRTREVNSVFSFWRVWAVIISNFSM
jgi:hypothetical protein